MKLDFDADTGRVHPYDAHLDPRIVYDSEFVGQPLEKFVVDLKKLRPVVDFKMGEEVDPSANGRGGAVFMDDPAVVVYEGSDAVEDAEGIGGVQYEDAWVTDYMEDGGFDK